MCGGSNPLEELEKAAKDAGKAVEKNVTQPVVGAVDEAGKAIQENIIDPIAEFGSSLEEAVRDAANDVNKVIENPYVQAIVSIINPTAGAVLSAYATLNSGDELSDGQIIALAAAGLNAADFDALPPETVAEIKKAAQVATAENPGRALVLAYGADIAEESGVTEAFDNAVVDTFGQETLDVLQQNENYVIDSARFATGDISEQELIAKYGAGAVDYATSGTALEDYNNLIADAINVGVGNTSLEEAVANRYGEDIVKFLGAETENERAVGLGGLTAATQLAMGKDPLEAAFAGTKRAYDEGARLEDLSFIPNQIAGLNVNLGDILPDLGINFDALKSRGYDLSSLVDLDFNLGKFNFQAPDIFDSGFELTELADLGVDFGQVDFSGARLPEFGDYSLPELKDLGVNIGDLNLDLELGSLGIAVLGEQQRQQLQEQEEEEDLLDGTLAFQSEFDVPLDEPSFAREVLGRRFT